MEPSQQKDYVTPGERIAGQDWSGVAKKGIAGMTPAETGWILAFVIIFVAFQVANYFSNTSRAKAEEARAERLSVYLTRVEENRSALESNRAQEFRRCQEMILGLTSTVAREAEREGRQKVQSMVTGKRQ